MDNGDPFVLLADFKKNGSGSRELTDDQVRQLTSEFDKVSSVIDSYKR